MGIMAVIGVPVLFVFGATSWVSNESQFRRESQWHAQRVSYLATNAQMLRDSVLHEIESIHGQIAGFAHARARHPDLSSPALPKHILHWAELRIREQGQLELLQSGRSSFLDMNTPQVNAYLTWVSKNLDLKQVSSHGVSLLRQKREGRSAHERLVLGFSGDEKTVLVALVDPEAAFPSFKIMRGFLLGSDGKVLVHTHQEMISAVFSKAKHSQNRLSSSWYQVAALPLYAGAEDIATALPLPATDSIIRFLLASLTFALIWGCASFLCRYGVGVKIITLTVDSNARDHRSPAQRMKTPLSQQPFFMGDELLILDSNEKHKSSPN
jgi:hypothetical protein